MVVEQHVWIGQGALVLGVERIGFGSIIGANALVRENLPHMSSCAGVPAKVLRTGVTWDRAPRAISSATKERLKKLMHYIETDRVLLLPANHRGEALARAAESRSY
jgi:carbonic anhydrase/acetyltransferase-like protein (isoleucine patch superfamily)